MPILINDLKLGLLTLKLLHGCSASLEQQIILYFLAAYTDGAMSQYFVVLRSLFSVRSESL